MSIFKKNEKSYVGVDLGSASLKVVELLNDRGRPRLLTYGYYERPLGEEVTESLKEQPETTGQLLKEIFAKAEVKSKKVIAALPTFNVFSSIISLPKLPPKELAEAVKSEAKKVVPLALEEMILDWKIIEPDKKAAKKLAASREEKGEPGVITKKGQEYQRLLLTATSKKYVQRYLDIFSRAGLTLLSLETESFALARSLVGREKAAVMIVDIGSTNTDITVIDHGIPVLNRSVSLGGVQLSKAISQALNVNLREAEQLKKDVGLSFLQEGSPMPGYFQEVIQPIVKELRYAMEEFIAQCQKGQSAVERAPEDCRVDKLIMTGGSATMPGLADYLSEALSRNVYVGDPWARVIYPNEMQNILNEIGSKFNVAVGLAMREIL